MTENRNESSNICNDAREHGREIQGNFGELRNGNRGTTAEGSTQVWQTVIEAAGNLINLMTGCEENNPSPNNSSLPPGR